MRYALVRGPFSQPDKRCLLRLEDLIALSNSTCLPYAYAAHLSLSVSWHQLIPVEMEAIHSAVAGGALKAVVAIVVQ